MHSNLLPIGKMAEMNHLSVATLRLYDEMGLLRPRYKDPKTGYRYYDLAQNARLDMIAYMKELGMSLAEIGEVLRKEDVARIETILAEKNEQLHRQIRALHARHNAVERAIASIERYRKSPARGTIALEYIDRRYLWGLPCGSNFYQKGIRAFEEELMTLRQALLDNGFTQPHSYSVGTSIAQADFTQRQFIPKETFVFLDYREKDQLPGVQTVDSGMYACIYADEYDDEIAYAERLLSHCRENGWSLCGDYLCEVMTEFNVFDSDRRGMFLRLQVPVKF